MRYGNAGVRETDKLIAMETCRMSHRKNRKHRPELQSHMAKRRRPTRSGVRRYRWNHRNSKGPYGTKHMGRTPHRISEMCTNDGNRQQRHGARGATKRQDRFNETDAKKKWLRARSGHSQKATAKPTAGANKATTKKERGMERVSDSNKASK